MFPPRFISIPSLYSIFLVLLSAIALASIWWYLCFYFSFLAYCHSLFILRELSRSRDFDVFTSLSLVLGTGPGTKRGSKQMFPIMNEFLYYLGRAQCLIQRKQSKNAHWINEWTHEHIKIENTSKRYLKTKSPPLFIFSPSLIQPYGFTVNDQVCVNAQVKQDSVEGIGPLLPTLPDHLGHRMPFLPTPWKTGMNQKLINWQYSAYMCNQLALCLLIHFFLGFLQNSKSNWQWGTTVRLLSKWFKWE